jgi:hypothetical protein
MAVVVDPASDRSIEHPGQVINPFIRLQMHPPSSYRLPHHFARLVAYRWCKVDEVFPIPILGAPRPKGIPQEVELDFGMISFSVIVLAVDNPGFLRMQFEFAFFEPFFKLLQQSFCFFFRPAVDDCIIRISCPRILGMLNCHPFVNYNE